MLLAILIIGPIIGGLLSWLLGRIGKFWVRIWPVLFLLLDFVILIVIWASGGQSTVSYGHFGFYRSLSLAWIPSLGISIHLVLDGLSLLLSLLTVFVGLVVLLFSWVKQRLHDRFFYFNISLVLAGVIGTFLSVDLFLFFLFWELMLVPTYFLIVGWGGEKRTAAGFKFFVFTQVSGLLMFVAILALYFIHGTQTGNFTFDLFALMKTKLSGTESMLIMLGFIAAFVVKLPVVPFHSWLPDSYTEAPIEGTIILAALMSKTGAYGLLRFVLPLFHHSAMEISTWAMAFGAAGIVYGAILAYGQRDLKRMIAYTSVSHLGFVFIGIFSLQAIAIQGAILQMISHGVATAGLFVVAAFLEERLNTRDLEGMGGLFAVVPRLGGAGVVFALIALGVPGSGNFLAEVLVVIGTVKANLTIAAVASTGIFVSVIYALHIVQKSFHGPLPGVSPDSGQGGHSGQAAGVTGGGAGSLVASLRDLSFWQALISVVMILVVFWLGIYPQPLFHILNHLSEVLQGGLS